MISPNANKYILYSCCSLISLIQCCTLWQSNAAITKSSGQFPPFKYPLMGDFPARNIWSHSPGSPNISSFRDSTQNHLPGLEASSVDVGAFQTTYWRAAFSNHMLFSENVGESFQDTRYISTSFNVFLSGKKLYGSMLQIHAAVRSMITSFTSPAIRNGSCQETWHPVN